MLGGQMAGGGIGVAVKEELVLLHATVEMGLGTDASALRRFAPLFVEVVEKWREITNKICAGEEPGPFTLPGLPGAPGGPPVGPVKGNGEGCAPTHL